MRFCSGLGISGTFPLTFAYLTETCSRSTRSRYVGVLHSMWPLGAIYISILFHLTMPTGGADIVQDNREHWSSWHRFLILSILPTLAGIVGLIWASESPRYLLEASREVEALAVYQRLHKLNKARTRYGLTELELPGRSAYRDRATSPSRNILDHGLEIFRQAFQRVSSPTYFRTTLLLAALHLLLGFLYMGVSTFSSSVIKELRDRDYFLHKQYVKHANFSTLLFNTTLENVEYLGTTFRNVTFSHVNLNHVDFVNCTIQQSEFIDVKASVSYFKNSTIKDSKFVDTDFTDPHFIDCHLVNNTFLSLISDCTVNFDYNIYLDDLYDETIAWAGLMFPCLFFMGFVLETVRRPPVIVVTLALAALAAAGFFIATTSFVVTTVELVVKILLMCALNAVTLVVVEAYPCHLRCTTHGMMRSLYHVASLCAIPIYASLAHTLLLFPAILTIALTICAVLLSTRIQDNSKVLL